MPGILSQQAPGSLSIPPASLNMRKEHELSATVETVEGAAHGQGTWAGQPGVSETVAEHPSVNHVSGTTALGPSANGSSQSVKDTVALSLTFSIDQK